MQFETIKFNKAFNENINDFFLLSNTHTFLRDMQFYWRALHSSRRHII